MWDPVKNHENRFSQNEAHLQTLKGSFDFCAQTDTVDGGQEDEEEREETKLKSKRSEKRTNTQQQENSQQTSTGPSVTCKYSSPDKVHSKPPLDPVSLVSTPALIRYTANLHWTQCHL